MPLTISSFLRDETFVLLVKEVASELYLDDIEKKKREKKKRNEEYTDMICEKREEKRIEAHACVCMREKEIDSRTSVRVTEYIRMIFTTR